MALEFRPKGTRSFDLYDLEGREGHYDETGHIGEIGCFGDPEEDDDATPPDEESEEQWYVDLWNNYGSGKTWYADAAESQEQAIEWAKEFYEEMVADRREWSRRGSARVISTPMGGQKRRR